MRIIGGRHRGRKLRPPSGDGVRPSSDRLREAVFNCLAHGKAAIEIEGLRVADICCGTGALGLEALSRGAQHAAFIDASPGSLRLARQNAQGIAGPKNAFFLKLDVRRLPPPPRAMGGQVDLVFLDPPYEQGLAPPALAGLSANGWLAPGALLVVEVSSREDPLAPPGYELMEERVYGAAKVYFLKRPA